MADDSPAAGSPAATLTTWDTVSVIVGIVIAVGIYKTPPLVFQNVGGYWSGMSVWALGGVLSLIGTRGDDLLIAHVADDCGHQRGRSVLSLFDPVTKDETHLTVLPRRESWREVLLASEVRSWIW